MKVAILSETFSPKMGYLQNCLPKYLARLGVDAHVITADLQPNYQIGAYGGAYGSFHDDALEPGDRLPVDGFTVHVLGHRRVLGYQRLAGLSAKLRELRPDVVQSMPAIGWIALDAARLKPALGYRLFTGCHTTASVFPLAQRRASLLDPERLRCLLTRGLSGRVVSWLTDRCYSATADCAEIAERYFGVQASKNTICPLGVDTERFRPIETDADRADRAALRASLGFTDSEIVCVYSGRFTHDKNPLVLARAIHRLAAAGLPFRGLFVGAGPQQDEIAATPGCSVVPFVPVWELGRYFRAGEIGVWPAQESMSMLDAAACGIPIVVNDGLVATERIDGNGVTYRLGDDEDLARVLRTLVDPAVRAALGECGARRMRAEFSWEAIARRRLADYEAALAAYEGMKDPVWSR